MSNIVSFKGANLPAVASLSTALRSISNNVGEAGVAILKMDKTGHWVFGADQTEVEDGSKWAVNPFSFVHGFIAWGDGEVLGEKMVSVTQPLPDMEAAPPNAKRGWEVQIGCSLKCISGDDEGLEVRFSTTSVGGKKAVQALAVEIAGAVEKDQTKPVPIVVLKKDHYVHKSYGRIYTPIFEVVEWVSMDGNSSEGDQAEEAESQTEEPRRRRRSV